MVALSQHDVTVSLLVRRMADLTPVSQGKIAREVEEGKLPLRRAAIWACQQMRAVLCRGTANQTSSSSIFNMEDSASQRFQRALRLTELSLYAARTARLASQSISGELALSNQEALAKMEREVSTAIEECAQGTRQIDSMERLWHQLLAIGDECLERLGGGAAGSITRLMPEVGSVNGQPSDSQLTRVPSLQLSNGIHLPRLGIGTYGLGSSSECTDAVRMALEEGVRLIDTAPAYKNERAVGLALKLAVEIGLISSVKDVFVSVKVADDAWGEQLQASVEESLKNLRLPAADLLLLHHPKGPAETLRAWRQCESLYRAGRARALGVCNFGLEDFRNIIHAAKVPVHAAQAKWSVHHQGAYVDPAGELGELRKEFQRHGVQIIGTSPFNELFGSELQPCVDPFVEWIAFKNRKHTSQVILHWMMQCGLCALFRTTSRAHAQQAMGSLKEPGLPDADTALLSGLEWLTASPMRPRPCSDDVLRVSIARSGLKIQTAESIQTAEKLLKKTELPEPSEADLELAGRRLLQLFSTGDFRAMLRSVDAMESAGEIAHGTPGRLALERVVAQNVEVAETRGQKVKVQVLNNLLGRLRRPDTVAGPPAALSSPTPLRKQQYQHAPQVALVGTATDRSNTAESSASRLFVQCCAEGVGQREVEAVADALTKRNWAVLDGFKEVAPLVNEFEALREHYEESQVWVGKGESGVQMHVQDVRGDRVLWVCGGHRPNSMKERLFDPAGVQPKDHREVLPCDPSILDGGVSLRKFPALQRTLKQMDEFVLSGLGKRCPTLSGLVERSDAMLTVYDSGGSRFVKHIDNTMRDGRQLTAILYLNEEWNASQGGELRLYPEASGSPIDVAPLAGRVVLFGASSMPHEVLPAWSRRRALSVWYFDRAERRDAVKRADSEAWANAASAAKAGSGTVGVQDEAAAKKFLQRLVAPESAGGVPATSAALEALTAEVKRLPDGALGAVAAILGAPSAQEAVAGVERLTPEALVELRTSLGHMGLGS